jgi:hypothetical protein
MACIRERLGGVRDRRRSGVRGDRRRVQGGDLRVEGVLGAARDTTVAAPAQGKP